MTVCMMQKIFIQAKWLQIDKPDAIIRRRIAGLVCLRKVLIYVESLIQLKTNEHNENLLFFSKLYFLFINFGRNSTLGTKEQVTNFSKSRTSLLDMRSQLKPRRPWKKRLIRSSTFPWISTRSITFTSMTGHTTLSQPWRSRTIFTYHRLITFLIHYRTLRLCLS